MSRIKSESGLWLSEEDEAINAVLRNGIADHLQSMNYDVTLLNGKFSVSNPRRYDFGYYFLQPYMACFSMFFEGQEQDQVPKKAFYEFINSINATAFVSSLSITKGADVFSKMTYIGGYDKIRFARTLELWDMDIRALLTHQDVQSFVQIL